MEELNITNNTKLSRFEATINGEIAVLDYRYLKDGIAFTRTYVPQGLRGRSIATKLVAKGVEFAIQQNKKIMSYCSFVTVYLERHKEYHKYVDGELQSTFRNS